ncbi:hypothetical protein BYT27DRAFT_7195574 [Phlegmacium glaucopus]|nr:hypothetical protein BYT27DRAFT_7195574 [Phlegmacium glaucopus]
MVFWDSQNTTFTSSLKRKAAIDEKSSCLNLKKSRALLITQSTIYHISSSSKPGRVRYMHLHPPH